VGQIDAASDGVFPPFPSKAIQVKVILVGKATYGYVTFLYSFPLAAAGGHLVFLPASSHHYRRFPPQNAPQAKAIFVRLPRINFCLFFKRGSVAPFFPTLHLTRGSDCENHHAFTPLFSTPYMPELANFSPFYYGLKWFFPSASARIHPSVFLSKSGQNGRVRLLFSYGGRRQGSDPFESLMACLPFLLTIQQ